MLPDRIIEQDTLTSDGERVAISVRIPWYRALPLSSVTNVSFSIDGRPVPTDSLTWTVNDHTYRLEELPPRYDEWWFVQDDAVLEGDLPELGTEEQHDVAVTVGLYIPYLPAGDGFIAIAEKDRKQMPLKEELR